MNQNSGIITFYSFKGGLGRSMAVANIGRLLARRTGLKGGLLIDWDLEAPGLETFFHESDPARRGLIDYFTDLARLVDGDPAFAASLASDDRAESLARALPLDGFVVDSGAPGLSLMTAAGAGEAMRGGYQSAVSGFDWVRLFNTAPNAIAAFRELLASRFEFTLIDARTGVSEISGMCTAILPDKLVAMFGTNRQSLGVLEIARAAVQFRRLSADDRPLVVFPLASRFDPSDLPGFQAALDVARSGFTKLFRDIYGLDECDLRDYLRRALLLYVPHYASGEPVVVHSDEPDYVGSLRRGYETFAEMLATMEVPWETSTPSEPRR